jgi:hypothetical protein
VGFFLSVSKSDCEVVSIHIRRGWSSDFQINYGSDKDQGCNSQCDGHHHKSTKPLCRPVRECWRIRFENFHHRLDPTSEVPRPDVHNRRLAFGCLGLARREPAIASPPQ